VLFEEDGIPPELDDGIDDELEEDGIPPELDDGIDDELEEDGIPPELLEDCLLWLLPLIC
ncbi:MAG: hypothetical protein HOK34_04985, partial [Gammaproteobacteria bacterium]|jgi:hypothetical protein|nr:hypothetical protein [Gammaproteobacteria bacterium]